MPAIFSTAVLVEVDDYTTMILIYFLLSFITTFYFIRFSLSCIFFARAFLNFPFIPLLLLHSSKFPRLQRLTSTHIHLQARQIQRNRITIYPFIQDQAPILPAKRCDPIPPNHLQAFQDKRDYSNAKRKDSVEWIVWVE